MTKTPEQLAEEYIAGLESQQKGCYNQSYGVGALESGFLAGYQAAKQWISVKDSEPSDETWVLGTNGRDIECVFKHFTDCYSMTTITHWMPLPEAPKEE
jgi:hypothetical protein